MIYYFYYEKYFNEKKLNIFNNNKLNYYLINPKWFNCFLAYYDYQNLYKSLIYDSKNNPQINYDNLNQFISSYVQQYSKQYSLKFEKGQFSNIINIENMFMKIKALNNKKKSFDNCYIIHSQIIDKINIYQFKN